MALRFPAAVDEQRFLAEYWQRKPLLLPDAMSGFLPALTASELAGLACAEDVEARLLRSAGPAAQWQLQHGPLYEEDFGRLPDTGWTLLVQDVDKFVPSVAGLLESFRFIPGWRIDDVMVSYAAPRGTVGPHADEYDVFLIQGAGSRVWETGRSSGTYIADLPVRVLEEFEVERRWELNSGDALYLPPGLPHNGYSDEACMTFSVGFRAPSVAELLLSQAAFRAERAPGRYRDDDLQLHEADGGLICEAAIERALRYLPGRDETPGGAAVWFGQLVTENKPWLQPAAPERPDTPAQFARRLENGASLQKHPVTRMAYTTLPGNGVLFADGEAWPLTAASRSVVPALCRGEAVTIEAGCESGSLLYQLYCEGKLYWRDDE